MSKYDGYEEEEEEYEEYDEDEGVNVISILSILSKGFIYFGVAIAVILFLYFFITGKFFTAFLYVIGLIAAYFFGYVFMFFLYKFVSMN